jgi:mannan endo-1,4-beta-mannosidase
MGAYIKTLDPWHLVTVGSEGFFNEARKEDWAYNGTDGVDVEALMKLTTVDFGTYHTYPVRRLFSSQPCHRFGLNWRTGH